MVVASLAAFAGTASAAPLSSSVSGTATWAYGGQNTSNGSATIGSTTISWNASAEIVVIFNATPTGPNTTELEVQRTIAIDFSLKASSPKGVLAVAFSALEADTAYANVTNASSVYVSGSTVPALGIDNASYAGHATIHESVVATGSGPTAFAYLNVSGSANAQVGFTPALGLVPLNLTGITEWNSTALATPSASWNISYAYTIHRLNATNASGVGGANGSWDESGPVALNGYVLEAALPSFVDHAARQAILLVVTGPLDLYDGFILVPHGFDLLRGGPHIFDARSFEGLSITGDLLYVSRGGLRVESVSASSLRVGNVSGALLPRSPATSASPAAPAPGLSAVVVAQPESVSAAQSQAHCLEFGCSAGAPWFSGLVAVALAGAIVAAVVGTVTVVEWRSYARRKARTPLVGGYGERLAIGVPPAAAQPPTIVSPPANGPETLQGPGRSP